MKNRVVLFMGIGQTSATSRYVQDRLPWLHAIPPLDYLAYPDGQEISEAAIKHAYSILSRNNPEIIIAESQAAPTIVATIEKHKTYPKKLILIQPLGCNTDFLGSTEHERYKELMRRSRKFWLHRNQSLLIGGNRKTLFEVFRQMAVHPTSVRTAYTFGANQSVVSDLKKIQKKCEVHVYAAATDSLFPYDEVLSCLSSVSYIYLHRLEGTHLNRATPKGISQLNEIYRELIQ